MKNPLKNAGTKASLDLAYRKAQKSLATMLRIFKMVGDIQNANKVKQSILTLKIAYNRGCLGWDDKDK
jgi:hypothetical protein